MPPQEQAELWMALRDRMKNNWSDLTLQEKRAGTLPLKHLLLLLSTPENPPDDVVADVIQGSDIMSFDIALLL